MSVRLRKKAVKSLASTKTRSHEKDDWVKRKRGPNWDKTKPQEKIKYIKEKFNPVFEDIDCLLPEGMIDHLKGKNDKQIFQFSRSKLKRL